MSRCRRRCQRLTGQKAEGNRQHDSQEIKYHISTYISQQDGKNKNSLWGVSITIFSSIFIFVFPYTIYHLPYSIFDVSLWDICICSPTLFRSLSHSIVLLHGLTPLARVGRQLPDPDPQLEPRGDPEPGGGQARDSYANALYANLSGHMIVVFFFCFPSPPISTFRSIMNYWSIGSLSKYKLSNKFERVLHLM